MKSSRRVSTVPSSSTMALRFRAICRTSRMGLWVSHRMEKSPRAIRSDSSLNRRKGASTFLTARAESSDPENNPASTRVMTYI